MNLRVKVLLLCPKRVQVENFTDSSDLTRRWHSSATSTQTLDRPRL
jgi:hypothetical protein